MNDVLHDAPVLLPSPIATQRIGRPSARGQHTTLVLARRALSLRPLAEPWRPSDVELDRIATFLSALDLQRIELRQTSTPGVALIGRGTWTMGAVAAALAHLVDPQVLVGWQQALALLPIGPIVRVEAAVDGRTDKTSFHPAMALQTTPEAPLTAQVRTLCEHLNLPEADQRWLLSVHNNLTCFEPRTVLATVSMVGDSLRPWLILRYPDAPVAAARAVRASVGQDPALDDELDALIAMLDRPDVTVEVRAARQRGPRVGVEA